MPASKSAVLGLCLAGLVTFFAFKVHEATSRRATESLAHSPLEPILQTGHAPLFSAPDREGKPVSLTDLRGRLVLLNFWFSDCAPCREEMPSLEALARRFAGRVEVLALSVDPSWEKVDRFLASDPDLRGQKPAYRILLDPQKSIPPRFGTFKYPETFLVAPDGALLARFVGPRNWAEPAAFELLEALSR
jgi:thiol-disulfide isomerase/thioredoxin